MQKQKIKLTKKQSFFSLYKKYILRIGVILFSILFLVSWYICPEVVGKTLEYLLNINIVGMSAFILYIFIPKLIDWILFIQRQLYIPLTSKELQDAKITTIREYNRFLIDYLKGHCPSPDLQKQIIKSAKEYFPEWEAIDRIYNRKDCKWTLKELKKYYTESELIVLLDKTRKEYLNLKDDEDLQLPYEELFFNEEDFEERISKGILDKEALSYSTGPLYFSYYDEFDNKDYQEIMGLKKDKYEKNIHIFKIWLGIFLLMAIIWVIGFSGFTQVLFSPVKKDSPRGALKDIFFNLFGKNCNK